MPQDRILVDLNSVAHAAHQGTVLKAGGQETQAVFGTLRNMRALKVRHPHASIIGLWDGRSWRKAHDSNYKANRTDDAQKRADRARYETQMPYLRRALRSLGLPQVFALNLEADDLASILSQRYTAAGSFVRLVTGDQDWIQLVNERCVWEDHREETRKVNYNSFKNYTGYATPLQFVQAKALQGDTSDNLKGVGKIGEKGALDLIEVWGRVEAFLADPDPAATYQARREKNIPKAFRDFHGNVDDRQQKFFHNMKMMNLLGDLPEPEKLTVVRSEFSPDDFKRICHELGFSSIYRDGAFENYTRPFEGATH